MCNILSLTISLLVIHIKQLFKKHLKLIEIMFRLRVFRRSLFVQFKVISILIS